MVKTMTAGVLLAIETAKAPSDFSIEISQIRSLWEDQNSVLIQYVEQSIVMGRHPTTIDSPLRAEGKRLVASSGGTCTKPGCRTPNRIQGAFPHGELRMDHETFALTMTALAPWWLPLA
jgi:hypothetical protein